MSVVAVSVIIFGLGAAACGGDSPQSDVASVGSTTTLAAIGTPGGAGRVSGGDLVEYATCMRNHGVAGFPDQASFGSSAGIRAAKGQISRISTSEATSPRFQAAERSCARYAPPSATRHRVSAGEMQKLLAVSRCMRTHGIPEFPDPNPTTGELSTPAGIDRSSPQVLGALRACSPLGRAAGLGPPNTGQ